jgi:periplasmic divalent cation tolerance protein
MTPISLIYCTVGTRDEALAIGRTLVTEQLAACANVFDGMTSLYHWDGALQEDREAVLLLKTRTDLVDRAMARVRALHSYDCPAILAWPLSAADADYALWIDAQTVPRPPIV